MFGLIGKKLKDAKKILAENNISNIKVIENNSNREVKSDTELVVQVRFDDDNVVLVTSKFLLKI